MLIKCAACRIINDLFISGRAWRDHDFSFSEILSSNLHRSTRQFSAHDEIVMDGTDYLTIAKSNGETFVKPLTSIRRTI